MGTKAEYRKHMDRIAEACVQHDDRTCSICKAEASRVRRNAAARAKHEAYTSCGLRGRKNLYSWRRKS